MFPSLYSTARTGRNRQPACALLVTVRQVRHQHQRFPTVDRYWRDPLGHTAYSNWYYHYIVYLIRALTATILLDEYTSSLIAARTSLSQLLSKIRLSSTTVVPMMLLTRC